MCVYICIYMLYIYVFNTIFACNTLLNDFDIQILNLHITYVYI